MKTDRTEDIHSLMEAVGKKAREVYRVLSVATSEQKDLALREAAISIRDGKARIIAANDLDLSRAIAAGSTEAMLDRLRLNPERVEAMAKGLEGIALLPDPVDRVLADWERPNGLRIQRLSVPLGVIGIIYESRPNVTADAAGLCLKSGNAAILRPGSESLGSSKAIMKCLHDGFASAGLPGAAIQIVPTCDRAAVGQMLTMTNYIDVIIPRGGKSLTQRVMTESKIPTIQHLDGNCHTYIHASADPQIAKDVLVNAKLRRTGICGATESVLIDSALRSTLLPPLVNALVDAGCEVRGDESVCAIDSRVIPATEDDWSTEYLDAVLSIKTVSGVDEAIKHTNHFGSHHTDAIIAEDPAATKEFLKRVDSAIVMVNTSTQFADGGEFGMGGEIGISTGRLHARGPVGIEQLTTYKYVVRGNGQTRT
ncbi:MAG: glutamate-5-semialdehyde dehydrogenase [Pyrinomonadaceae bacterium]